MERNRSDRIVFTMIKMNIWNASYKEVVQTPQWRNLRKGISLTAEMSIKFLNENCLPIFKLQNPRIFTQGNLSSIKNSVQETITMGRLIKLIGKSINITKWIFFTTHSTYQLLKNKLLVNVFRLHIDWKCHSFE